MSLGSRSLARVVIRIALFATCALFVVPPVVSAYTPHHPGRWTEAMAWDDIAIHVALLRGDMGPIRKAHSRILWWGGRDAGLQKQGLWDWRLDQDRAPFALTQNVRAQTIPQPPFDIFCSGHSFLPHNGDLFITGGHEGNNIGLTRTAIFDRDSLKYRERADEPAQMVSDERATRPSG
jgi:hypothetical protein